MDKLSQHHAVELIQGAIFRRIENTIGEYLTKNEKALVAFGVERVHWKANIDVVTQNEPGK